MHRPRILHFCVHLSTSHISPDAVQSASLVQFVLDENAQQS